MKDNKELFEETLDKLCDEENCDPIVLFSSEGKEIAFEQIALIPDGNKLYVILKPVQKLEGLGEDEGLVFYVNEELCAYELVTDEEIIDKVFGVYDELIAAAQEDENE